jgi:hypothetical protein
MRAKLLAAALLLAATPAAATTYTYEGNPYGYNNAPELFGTNATGTMTFGFDTSSFTGYVPSFGVDFSFTFGASTYYHPVAGGGAGGNTAFYLENGQLLHWSINGAQVACATAFGTCYLATSSGDGAFGDRRGDFIINACHFCSPTFGFEREEASSHLPGHWTMVTPTQVPGPVVGAGLPALMMLLAWLMARRQCARSC